MAPPVKSIDPFEATPAYYAAATSSTSPRVIHVSGQVGATKSGHVPADYESQIHLALFNLRKVLVASHAAVNNIAKLTLYIVNYDASHRVHTRHLQKFLGSHRPAVTLVPLQKLAMPEWLFEIEAVLAIPAESCTPPMSLAKSTTPASGYDVIIVGAGLSGLTAAREVTRAGLSCVVLEARDRVGGKTWSKTLSDGVGVVDLGAAWINDTNQSRMIALAREIGAELVEQNTEGDCVFQDFDGSVHSFPYGELPKFDPSVQKNVAYIRDLSESECQKLDPFNPQNTSLDSLTFAAFLQQNGASPTAAATAAIWTRAMLGQEPTEVSAMFFLNYCKAGGGLLQMRSDRRGGGQHLRVRLGTQTFSEGLAASLPKDTIKTSTEVVAIRQTPNSGVEVTTNNGIVLHAKKAILSLPSPCLTAISFTPPLPSQITALLASATYGYYTKAMLVFSTPFWTSTSHCGLAQSFKGPAAVIRDTSSPADSKHVLTCFLGGDPGRAWSLLPEHQRIDALLKQVAQLFAKGDDAFVTREFVEYVESKWMNEKLSGWGCPCAALGPGVLDACGEALGKAVGDVHFVGTETEGVWKGYMEGAVRSGERGAREVVEALRERGGRARL